MIWVDVGMVGRMSLSRVVVKGRGSFMVGMEMDGKCVLIGWGEYFILLWRSCYFVIFYDIW